MLSAECWTRRIDIALLLMGATLTAGSYHLFMQLEVLR